MFNLLIILIILIISFSEAFNSQDIFERNPDESISKYCPSALLSASHNKVIKGQLSFYQDSKGAIWLTGAYQWGFQNPDEWHYNFTIQNGCQEIIYDLTEELQTEFAKNSGCDGYDVPIEEPPVVNTIVVTKTAVIPPQIEPKTTPVPTPIEPKTTPVIPPKNHITPVSTPKKHITPVQSPKKHITPVQTPKKHITPVPPQKVHKTPVPPQKVHKTPVPPSKVHKTPVPPSK
ncbi:8881_t:CDS:1, partial [Gigaspora margarita]